MSGAAEGIDIVREFPDTRWSDDAPTRAVEPVVENGGVLSFPHLAFPLSEAERRFLDPRWADGKAKNISLRWPSGELRGAAGTADELAQLRAMVVRYAEASERFALRLFPHYRGHLRRGNTTFRPAKIEGRETSWRQDDTRLHMDAFPSNPMHGTRLLRVFCNVNPAGAPREWRVGEPFEAFARRYLPSIKPPLAGSAWVLEKLGVTKRRRTEYDHVMLQLHDLAKADAAFQRSAPQARVDFAPGTDLGGLQRPGAACGDGPPAPAGADFLHRRRAPPAPRKLAAAYARATSRPSAALRNHFPPA